MDLPPESLACWISSERGCQVSSYRWMVFLLISVQNQDSSPPSITLKFLLRPNVENMGLKSRLLPENDGCKCYNRSLSIISAVWFCKNICSQWWTLSTKHLLMEEQNQEMDEQEEKQSPVLLSFLVQQSWQRLPCTLLAHFITLPSVLWSCMVVPRL